MIKSTTAVNDWFMYDNTRKPTNPNDLELYANNTNAEYDSGRNVNFTSTGFELDTANFVNNSGDTYIYMAFADTREYAYWLDQSGNNNDWTSNSLTESDISVDSPTNNFCTWNPLAIGANCSLAEGNLKATPPTTQNQGICATLGVSTGKWYWEVMVDSSAAPAHIIGIANTKFRYDTVQVGSANTDSWGYYQAASKWHNGNLGSYGVAMSNGDIVGVLLDLDNNTLAFNVNNSSQGTAFSSLPVDTYVPACGDLASTDLHYSYLNCGQDSSFAGNKTAQGFQDSGGIGDFYYEPPSGFKALCSQNLDTPTVIPSEHVSTVLYGGSATTPLVVTGAGFAPDMVWLKARDVAWSHGVFSRLNGIGAGSGYKYLHTNTNGAEADTWGAITLDSDGWSGVSSGYDGTFAHDFGRVAKNFVSWNWKAGGAGVSNTDGTRTSSVSANAAAGFSIVSYTGNGTAGATVGHGLSQIPDMIITKGRSNSGQWVTWQKDLTGAFDSNGAYVYLNSTGQPATTTVFYDGTGFTSSVFKWRGGNENVNQSSRTYVSYCFNNVDGFLKTGTYGGNGSTNGPFVHCGFKPAYVMVKRTDAASDWHILDSTRNNYNDVDSYLEANTSNAEATHTFFDFNSNGFKVRNTTASFNASGGTFVFLAFAESPFKHSTAR